MLFRSCEARLRAALLVALAPGRLEAYGRARLSDECRAWLRMAEGSDLVSRWMRLGKSDVQRDVTSLLQAWVVRACPGTQDLAGFSDRVLSGLDWQRHCSMPQLLLLADLAAAVSHLVRSGQPLYGSLEELAQVSHLLARWHMPEHLKTRRTSNTWLQWLAVVVPALWLVLLWAMQLRAGVRRRSKARRGARFLHPLVQLALCQGAQAGPEACRALDEFLVRQCQLVVSPPPRKRVCTSWRAA